MNYQQVTKYLKSIGHDSQDCNGSHVYEITLLDCDFVTQKCIYCGSKRTMSHKALEDEVKLIKDGSEVSLYE